MKKIGVHKIFSYLVIFMVSVTSVPIAFAGQENNYDYTGTEWPRARSALVMFNELNEPNSGFNRSKPIVSDGRAKAASCSKLFSKLSAGEFKKVEPLLITDNPDHTDLLKYRKSCPKGAADIDGVDVPINDYLTELIGQYNYQLYRIPIGGRYGRGPQDFICADIDPARAMPHDHPGCYFPDAEKCQFVRYKNRPLTAGAIGISAGVFSLPSTKRRFDLAYPYGFSVVTIEGKYLVLEAHKSPVRDGEYYSFNFASLKHNDDLNCGWSYTKGK